MRNNGDLLANAIAVVFTTIQSSHTLQIISIVLTVLSVAVSLAFNIWKWWKLAKKDNNITIEEIDELNGHITNAIDKTNEILNKENKNDDQH